MDRLHRNGFWFNCSCLIINQEQSREDPRPLPDRHMLGSVYCNGGKIGALSKYSAPSSVHQSGEEMTACPSS